MVLLDGKKTSQDIKNEIAAEVQKRKEKGLKTPHLAAVIVGSDGASMTYVSSKVKSCHQVGFNSTLMDSLSSRFPDQRSVIKECYEKISRRA